MSQFTLPRVVAYRGRRFKVCMKGNREVIEKALDFYFLTDEERSKIRYYVLSRDQSTLPRSEPDIEDTP